jgi:hypothetical protein
VRIELTSSAWKAEVIASIRYPHGRTDGIRTHTERILSPMPLPIGLLSLFANKTVSHPRVLTTLSPFHLLYIKRGSLGWEYWLSLFTFFKSFCFVFKQTKLHSSVLSCFCINRHFLFPRWLPQQDLNLQQGIVWSGR